MLLDIHGHPPLDRSRLPAFIAALERFVSRVLVSELGGRERAWQHVPEVAHWQEGNAMCAELVRRYPQRLLGYCYVNPEHGREALAEMEHRLLGEPDVFAALKLWVAVRCSDARLDPLMEFCAAHDVPVLQHTWMKVGPSGPGSGNLAGESTPGDLLTLARRHPRVRFFGGHVGGDWEWGVAALKQADNVWLDIAGGDATGGYMELALRAVGAERIVFGTDVPGRSVPSQLAKVLALDLPAPDLERILWRNAATVLGERLPPAWRERYSPAPPLEGRAEGRVTFGVGDAAPSPTPLPSMPPIAAGGLVDVNCWIGEWPSRRIGGSPPPSGGGTRTGIEQRRELLQRLGIRRAAVSLLEGVWLKDAGVANAELFALAQQELRLNRSGPAGRQAGAGAQGELGRDRDAGSSSQFFPVYTVNPTFPTWAEHLDRCVGEYGLARGRGAVRLSPHYHGYALDAPELRPCLARLAELGLPLLLTWQLEDVRMQHPRQRVPDLDSEAVAALVTRWAQLRWTVTGATQTQILATARRLLPSARVWFDLARVQGPIDGIPILCREIGVGRLLFGTNLPLHVPHSPILELADAKTAGLSPEEDAAIRNGNAVTALGIDSQT
ncbi:MAG: amidohydrolase family protein [Chloroflexota bacterium]|nr:amidohydrolase family protein [Chloroflexota bacterium]